MSERYDHRTIEARWRARWTEEPPWPRDISDVTPDEKFYNLVEFPYPSAEGLHVGHAYTYCGADTYGRYLRMRGKRVFQPMGFDSFGIHTENFALTIGEHPMTLTERTIANYRRQLRGLGAAWDWDYEVITSDPSYYRWTQWIFVKLFEAGLVERKEAPVVWCPSCLTVLAFEQLEGDRCERCGSEVVERRMEQWFLKITAYADQLLASLDDLDWPEISKRLQGDWIGRSEGVEVDFPVRDTDLVLSTFTTRLDTLFGVTFLAVPPELPELDRLTTNAPGVRAFVEQMAASRGPGSRRGPPGERRGVFTGARAVHPLTGEDVPIWVTDYVVASYGTGAVMGVPAHDERDFAFARSFGLPVIRVIEGGDLPWTGEGALVASGSFSAMASERAREAIAAALEELDRGRRTVRYRLRDWLISRQRYWGPPIPIVHCPTCGALPVPEDQLPVELPFVEDFRPTGSGLAPLAAVEDFVHTTCPSCGGDARREAEVSDTFLDSSWYFLRYPSNRDDERPWDPEVTERMLPVDLYAGGREHVVRHHLYARFVVRALHDLGHVPFAEPFPHLRLHGLLLKDGAKMSKSRGNVVNPDEYVDRVGADVLRMALLFCGDWEEGGDFTDAGVAGIERFLSRARRLVTLPPPAAAGGVDLRPLDRAVARVGRDLERLRFNTAIAALMELVRWIAGAREEMSAEEIDRTTSTLVLLLAPFAPHLAEELWERLGRPYSVHAQPWPDVDPTAIQEDTVTLVVQVDGKVRSRIEVSPGIGEDEARRLALESDAVTRHLDGREPSRVVYVPDRLINFVTGHML